MVYHGPSKEVYFSATNSQQKICQSQYHFLLQIKTHNAK